MTANTNYSLAEIQGMQFHTASNANGNGTFGFIVQDDGGTANGGVDTLSNSLTITVNPVNDAPVANDDILWVSESTTVTLPVSVLLENDTDIDGKAITFQSITTSDPRITDVTFDPLAQTFTLTIAEHSTDSSNPAWTVTT